MSWLKAASNGTDDVFDANADELDISAKEWALNMKRRIRDGYVDGADAGEDAALEAGFKEGFREGAAKTRTAGRLRGIVCAIGSWYQVEHGCQAFPASVADLLKRVSQHEDSIVTEITKAMEKPDADEAAESLEELLEELRAAPARVDRRTDTDSPGHRQTPSRFAGAADTGQSTILGRLLQSCRDVAAELGLPPALSEHIDELENMERTFSVS